jgi:hypothetical protein
MSPNPGGYFRSRPGEGFRHSMRSLFFLSGKLRVSVEKFVEFNQIRTIIFDMSLQALPQDHFGASPSEDSQKKKGENWEPFAKTSYSVIPAKV